jgi:hypothetical protein
MHRSIILIEYFSKQGPYFSHLSNIRAASLTACFFCSKQPTPTQLRNQLIIAAEIRHKCLPLVLDNNNLKDSKPQSNHNVTTSLFQVIEIPGKNLGCVATQDMPKGTLISNENPQLKCRKDGDWMQDLMTAFMAMSKEYREAFMNLYDDRKNIVTDRNLELCNENTLKCISREFGLEKGKYDVRT